MSQSIWPGSSEQLEELQRTLAARWPGEPAWRPLGDRVPRVGAVFAASPRGLAGAGAAGDAAWVAAVVLLEGRVVESVVVRGRLDAPYTSGLLAMRQGRLLEEAVRSLRAWPDVLIVNATGRDHPRRAGLAIHLGVACELPTIGVTDRPLVAVGPEPDTERGASAALRLEGELVGYRLRTCSGARAVVVHAGWRVDPDTARELALAVTLRSRTPEPLRQARERARTGRSTA